MASRADEGDPETLEQPRARSEPPRGLGERSSLVAFMLSAVILVFAAGAAVGRNRVFPYTLFERAYDEYAAFRDRAKAHNLTPVFHRFVGVRVHDASKVQPGVTLLTSAWSDDGRYVPSIRVIDATGRVLHQWRTDPAEIWPESPYSDEKSKGTNQSDNYVHGTYLFENGDVLFNIEYLTVARMNARGQILWKLPIRAHHSIERDADGNFWICSMRWLYDSPEDKRILAGFPGLKPPVVEDFAVKISGDGKILKQISVTRAMYDANEQSLLWRSGTRVTGDILHTNDVEPLLPALAPEYPLFAPGDIAVSARTVHSIFVIDPESGRLKWVTSGFVKQHDVDFIGGGVLRVFDNRNDDSETGKFLGPTRLTAVQTSDRTTKMLYPPDLKQAFYTQWGGKAQSLPNGNLLLSEARRGRVLEVDPAGRPVWEWVHEPTGDGMMPEVLEGTRYPFTPEQVAAWPPK